MAAFICANSGLRIGCSHFPIYLENREACHPIFHAPQRTLFSYARKWAGNELTRIDSYLLYLALLKSTNRVFFRVPAMYRDNVTDAIVANNMEKLMVVISRMNSINSANEIFSGVAISTDSADLSSSPHWIDNWNENYEEFKDNYSFASSVKRLTIREAALEKMIKSPHKDVSSYASDLAKWASVAGNFPAFLTPVDGFNIPICDYWESIIIAAAQRKYTSIPSEELSQVIEHCEINIPPGSIYHHKLLVVLRDAKDYLKGFLGMVSGSSVLTKLVPWTFAPDAPPASDADENIDAINIHALLSNAPIEEPRRDQFPSHFKYIAAKIKWDAAVTIRNAQKEQERDQNAH